MRSLSLRCQWPGRVTEADRRPDLVSEALAAQWHSRRIAPRGIGRPLGERASVGAARAVRVTMECGVWGAPFSCRGCGRARRAHSTPAGRLRSNSWPAVTAPPEAPGPPGLLCRPATVEVGGSSGPPSARPHQPRHLRLPSPATFNLGLSLGLPSAQWPLRHQLPWLHQTPTEVLGKQNPTPLCIALPSCVADGGH